MNACTIIAKNYLPMPRVLASSFLKHHPDGRFTTLVVDDVDYEIDQRSEPFELIRPNALDIGPNEFGRMAMIYGVTELSTAIKPWFLRYLLTATGATDAAYFDPDIWIFDSLEDVADL